MTDTEQNFYLPEEPPFEEAPVWYNSDMASSWEAGRQAGWDAALAQLREQAGAS